jgi:hypothetical protein
LRERVEELQTAGVSILVPPTESDTVADGEPPGKKVLTCLFQDPDGSVLSGQIVGSRTSTPFAYSS